MGRLKPFSGKGKNADSFLDRSKEKWIRQLQAWMLTEQMPITRTETGTYQNKSIVKAPLISFFIRVLDSVEPLDERAETEKDIWELDKLGLEIRWNPVKNYKTLNFTKIYQPDIRSETKKAIYLHLKSDAISTVSRQLTAMRRFSLFLKDKHAKVESCRDIDREIFEEYLIFLQTEYTQTKQFHGELSKLRSVLETIGKVYQYPQLESLILKRDIPPNTKAEFKVYSDGEMKRFNAALIKMDEQTVRLMIIHQMLGTRISDTLTLRTDCLREEDGVVIIRIKQMKTHPYEKPISEELAALIRRAISHTKDKYGETKYIFVNEQNPEKPMQYGTLQQRIVRMIYREGLKDDEGKYFGFGTHMYRHYYGVKLTEMHLDDWTIAKLLGHSSVSNVRYYRKMSNQILADETRRARHRLSEMILENLDGWGEEYEQIRYDDSLE